MAFSTKTFVLLAMLLFVLLGNLNFVAATAVPADDRLAFDVTKSLNTRNTSMEMHCPPGQPQDQAGW
jgi:hypothetical protein